MLHDDATASYSAQPQTIAQFELIERVGMGHFGSVWKARDVELDRMVAVKVPRRDQLSSSEVELFLREARAAAQLRHPNIVALHEVGRHEGQLYIVSDFIDGANLKEWLGATRITPAESAALCETIAIALEHAHKAGVVHRDLKPGNIMMDHDGVPHIMDFGLAKRDSGEITMTMDGKVLGTPAYMSPEQASGQSHRADGRSDVYALGVMLFEMLTGELPFRGEKRMLLLQIQRDDPPSPRQLNNLTPRDLETICLKCLEKAPGKRFSSAQEVADELARFRERRPIRTRPISRAGRLWRLCQRNPAVAALTTGLGVVLLVGLIAVTGLWLRAARFGRRESEARTAAEVAKSVAQREENRAKDLLYSSDMRACQLALDGGDFPMVRELLARHLPSNGQDRRDVEWHYYWSAVHPGEAIVYHSPDLPDGTLPDATSDWLQRSRVIADANAFESIETTVVTPNARLHAWLDERSGQLEVYELPTSEETAVPTFAWDVPKEFLENEILGFSTDSQHIVLSGEGVIEIRELATGETEHSFVYSGDSCRFARILGNDEYLVASNGEHFWAWSLDSGEMVTELELDVTVVAAELAPDGSFLTALGDSGELHVYRLGAKQHLEFLNPPEEMDFHFRSHGFQNSSDQATIGISSDGVWVATSRGAPVLTVWNTRTNSFHGSFLGHTEGIQKLTFGNDGRLVSSDEHFSVVWDLDTISTRAPIAVQTTSPMEGATPDFYVKNERLWCRFSRSAGGEMADVECGRVPELALEHTEWLKFVLSAQTASEDLIAVCVDGHELVLMDRRRARLHARFRAHDAGITELRFSPDGELLFSADADGIGKVWSAHSQSLLWQTSDLNVPKDVAERGRIRLGDRSVAHYPETRIGQFSPDGKFLAILVGQGEISIRRSEDGSMPQGLKGHPQVVKVAFSPDGRRLALLNVEGAIRVRHLDDPGEKEIVIGSLDVTDILFSPLGKTIVAIAGNEIQFWDLATGHSKGAVALPVRFKSGFAFNFTQPTYNRLGLDSVGRVVVFFSRDMNASSLDSLQPSFLLLGRGEGAEPYEILGTESRSPRRPPSSLFDGGMF